MSMRGCYGNSWPECWEAKNLPYIRIARLSTNYAGYKDNRKYRLNFSQDGSSITFCQNCLNYADYKCSKADIDKTLLIAHIMSNILGQIGALKQMVDQQATYSMQMTDE